MVRLHRALQAVEAGRPQLAEERVERAQALGIDDVEPAPPLPADGHEAGLAQNLEVLRHRLLADVEVPADLAGRPRPGADEAEQRLPAGVGPCSPGPLRAP